MHTLRLPFLATLLASTLLFVGCGGESNDASTAQQAADDMAEAHQDDTPEATAAAREPMIPVEASTVPYATTDAGRTINGYIAAPENPDSVLAARGMDPETDQLPAVVVIHEWWGLNDNIRTATRRIAGEGYRALAVDLYEGSTADTPDGARDLMQMAMEDRDQLIANLKAAQTYLETETDAPRVAVMGWCFGGSMTLAHAVAAPQDLAGAVVYYGSPNNLTEDDLAAIEFPILGFFGGQDGSIPVSDVQAFEETLNEVGVDNEIHIYDAAGHAFANPSGTNYDPDAAADAWDKTTTFLNDVLYGNGDAMASRE